MSTKEIDIKHCQLSKGMRNDDDDDDDDRRQTNETNDDKFKNQNIIIDIIWLSDHNRWYNGKEKWNSIRNGKLFFFPLSLKLSENT